MSDLRQFVAALIIYFVAFLLDLSGWICPEAEMAYLRGIVIGMKGDS